MFILIFIGLSLLAGVIILGFRGFLNAELTCTHIVRHMPVSKLEYELYRTDIGKARSLDEVHKRVGSVAIKSHNDTYGTGCPLTRKTNSIKPLKNKLRQGFIFAIVSGVLSYFLLSFIQDVGHSDLFSRSVSLLSFMVGVPALIVFNMCVIGLLIMLFSQTRFGAMWSLAICYYWKPFLTLFRLNQNQDTEHLDYVYHQIMTSRTKINSILFTAFIYSSMPLVVIYYFTIQFFTMKYLFITFIVIGLFLMNFGVKILKNSILANKLSSGA